MSTLVELGFRADSSDLIRARRNMDSLTDAGGRTDGTLTSLQRTVGLVSAAFVALGTATATRQAIDYSESWKMVNNQLRIVVDSEEELIQTRTKLLGLSKDTSSNLLATTSLYAELFRNTRSLNTEQSQLLTVTGTLNNLFVAGAKDADTQKSAIRQLSQALGTGALRGDEYISVTEAAPRVIDALSKSLGIAKGNMRDFAATGGITSQVLIKALTEYSDTAQDLFNKTDKTQSQYFENAYTNTTEYIGQIQWLTDAIDSFGSGVEEFTEDLDSATDAAAAFALVIGVAITASLGKSAAATVASVAAGVSLTRQRAAQAVATQTAIAAEVALLRTQQSNFAASIANIQSENIRATLRTRLAAVTGTLAAAEATLATATATAATASAAATTSTIALTGATTALGAATRFLMGPWGLLITALGVAGAAFISSKDDADELKDSLGEQEKVVSDLERAYKQMTTAQAAESYLTAQKLLIGYDQQRLDIQTKINDITNSGNIKNFGLISGLKTQLAELDESAKKPQQRLDAILEVMNGNILGGEWTDRLNDDSGEKPTGGGKLTTAQKEYKSWLDSVTGFQTPLEMAIEKITKVNDAIAAGLPVTEQVKNYLINASTELANFNETAEDTRYSDWLEKISSESTSAKLQSIQDEITKTWLALDGGDLDKSAAMEHIDELEKRAKELKGTLTGSDMFASVADSAVAGLKSIQGLSAQGSKEYEKLGIAIQAVTAIQAVQAVVNQAAGTNPYESFAKMAAMVAALGSLGVSVGGLSGGFKDDSAANQDAQGLDSWGDKSDSISAAIDITANATDQLVGINTNMLSALQTMSDSISSAIAISLRGGLLESPEVDVYSNVFREMGGIVGSLFGTITDVFENSIMTLFSPITSIFLGAFDFIGGWLGGSSKTTDQGLQIVGGTLAELASDADINAYVDTKYKKWRFGSTKRRTDYADLDDASAQFSLVFASLADSVYEGAVSLGFGTAEITNAVNNFRIKTQEISLKGLSADAQQTAIENVFSSIFDSLALSVVSFLPDFQKVGEGYGETLARVANEVAVAEVIVDSLGVTLGDKLANPKMYVTIASNLSTLVGGLEEFASKTASFIDSFAPDSVKLGIYTDAMKESLEGVGLSLPDTTEGFYNLMSGLDGTTDAGQNQIATLLSLTETADDYYSLLDSTVGNFNDSLKSLTSSILSTIDSMFGITYDEALTSLDDALTLARAGSFDAALNLDLNSVQANKSDFETLADFNIAQAKTGNKLSQLSTITGETKSTADYALNESIEQTSLLSSLKAQAEETNLLLRMQNKFQASSADFLDNINNKTEYAA